jgi:hypothetical protein
MNSGNLIEIIQPYMETSLIPVQGRAIRAVSHESFCRNLGIKEDTYNPDYKIGRLVKHMQKKDMKRVYEQRGQILPIGIEMSIDLLNTPVSYIPDTVLLRIAKRLNIEGDVFSVKRALYAYSL